MLPKFNLMLQMQPDVTKKYVNLNVCIEKTFHNFLYFFQIVI